MTTIYVYDNDLLGDNGTQWAAALIDQHGADTAEACQAWFDRNYNINDYTSSFTGPVPTETWEAWTDGNEADAVRFTVPAYPEVDITQAGADALGIEVSDAVNTRRI